jgi:hypothetical protein
LDFLVSLIRYIRANPVKNPLNPKMIAISHVLKPAPIAVEKPVNIATFLLTTIARSPRKMANSFHEIFSECFLFASLGGLDGASRSVWSIVLPPL